MKWIVLAAVLVLLVLVWAIWRREKCKRKVRRMDPEEKCSKLNDLAEPFGLSMIRGRRSLSAAWTHGSAGKGMRLCSTGSP